MKYIKVTKENFSTIAFYVKQWFQNHPLSAHQGDWGSYPKKLNQLNISSPFNMKHIEKTMVSKMSTEKTIFEIGTYGSDPCLFIRPTKDSVICIKPGLKIKITPKHIFTKEVNNTLKRPIKTTYWDCPETEREKINSQIDFENGMSYAYWADQYEDEMEEFANMGEV